jgi:hypothetical protein
MTMNQTLRLTGTSRSRVSADIKESVQQFWLSRCQVYYKIDELTNEDTKEYHLYLTDTACWVLYQQDAVARHADLLQQPQEAGEDEADDEAAGDDAYDEFRHLLRRKQRIVVGRTTFFSLKPSTIVRGQDRQAACPHCRKYAAASRRVTEFIDPELHNNCANRAVCRRTQNCPMVAALEAAGLNEDDAAALATLRGLQAERDEHRRIRIEQKRFVDATKENLAHDECLICMDFFPVNGGYGPETTLGEGMGAYQALMVTVFYREGGAIKCQHVCFISPGDNRQARRLLCAARR